MALRTVPRSLPLAVALVLVACRCEGDGGVGCAKPQTATCAPVTDCDGTTFRAVVAPLLAELPSAAAATGFASMRSAGAEGLQAFGLCFGEPDGCLTCLSASAAAVIETCGIDTRRAGVWRDGCLLAYTDGPRDQALVDLAMALAEPKEQSFWKKALSVLYYALAAVGLVAVVLLLCLSIAAFAIAQSLVRHTAAGRVAAAGHGGEGITAYFVATDGRSPIWSVGVQARFYY